MSNILCVYYSRTGRTETLMQELAQSLGGCELVKLTDGVERGGLIGWVRSGLDAMARHIPPVEKPETRLPLGEYDLVIVGTPVWAGRCCAPVRSFLLQWGEELRAAAWVLTRGSDVRYEEVFQQMDLYVKKPRRAALTIRPGMVGAEFWKEEFLKAVCAAGDSRREGGDA